MLDKTFNLNRCFIISPFRRKNLFRAPINKQIFPSQFQRVRIVRYRPTVFDERVSNNVVKKNLLQASAELYLICHENQIHTRASIKTNLAFHILRGEARHRLRAGIVRFLRRSF